MLILSWAANEQTRCGAAVAPPLDSETNNGLRLQRQLHKVAIGSPRRARGIGFTELLEIMALRIFNGTG